MYDTQLKMREKKWDLHKQLHLNIIHNNEVIHIRNNNAQNEIH